MVITKLMRYVKQECANYMLFYNMCIFSDTSCLISEGKRCPYFERVLLPIAEQQGVSRQIKKYYDMGDIKATRSCPDCGAELAYRKRYCNKCTKRRRRASQKHS